MAQSTKHLTIRDGNRGVSMLKLVVMLLFIIALVSAFVPRLSNTLWASRGHDTARVVTGSIGTQLVSSTTRSNVSAMVAKAAAEVVAIPGALVKAVQGTGSYMGLLLSLLIATGGLLIGLTLVMRSRWRTGSGSYSHTAGVVLQV